MTFPRQWQRKPTQPGRKNLVRKTFSGKIEEHMHHLAEGLTLQKNYFCPQRAVTIPAIYKLE